MKYWQLQEKITHSWLRKFYFSEKQSVFSRQANKIWKSVYW